MLEDLLAGKESLLDKEIHTELRAQENRYRFVNILQGNLVSNSRSEISGISARVYKNGVYGFASAPRYSEKYAEIVLKEAMNNARLMDKRVGLGKGPLAFVPNGYVDINKCIEDTEQKKIIELCREVDDYIVKNCHNITSRSVTYSEDSMDKILYCSNGHNGHTTYPRVYLYVSLGAETKEGMPIELFESVGGFGNFQDRLSNLKLVFEKVDKVYNELMEKREAVHTEAGYKTVILDGQLAGMLAHEAVGHTVEADLVMGGSVAGPSLNTMVASELITMVDYAHTVNGEMAPLPVYLDDEGTPAEDAVLIKDGKLVGFMNNRETALKYDMKPTGNGRASSFSDEPLIRMRNTAILPGNSRFEEMIESVEDGYYLKTTNNGQADLTGEFMFGICSGYEIKKGKLGRPILDTTVSGIAFDMLKTVDMISDNMIWTSSGMCGKKQMIPVSFGGPDVRCKIMIGGR